ncbi:unnamed protein product [Hymenolepis diminuta]|uniref:XRN2-binding (XTBD) domain-containing protein n=1 Tax=Hymenolepis diminuta TaxID=6216 RepID=A0A0R3SVF1_HYMDI|nr:unnamed protein product [Hymenolepis diminuta]
MHKHLKPEKVAEEELVEWSDMFLSFLSKNYPLNRKKNVDEVTYIVESIGKSLIENYGVCINEEDEVNREQEERIKKYLPKPTSSKKKKSKSKSKSPVVAGVETVKDKATKENISESKRN